MNNEELINETTDVTPLAVPVTPTNLVIAIENTINARLTWDSVEDAQGYIIYRSETEDGTFTQIAETSQLTYLDTYLTPNTTYYYEIASYNADGESQRSDVVSVTTGDVEMPTDVTVDDTTNTSVTLSWTAPENYDSFNVYRSEAINGTYTQIANVTDTSYVDTGLTANTTYYYRVATVLNSVASDETTAVSATTTDNIETITAPTNVRAIKLSCNSIEIRWNLVNGAISYNVYRSTSLNGTYSLVGTSYGFNYYDENLTNGTTYYYYVVSVNADSTSERSTIVTNTTYATCQSDCFNNKCYIVINNGNVYECCCLRRNRCRCCS